MLIKLKNNFIILKTSIRQISNFKFLNETSKNLVKFNKRIILTDKYGSFTYESILNLCKQLTLNISKSLNLKHDSNVDLKSQKIGIFCSNNYTYLISILSIWMLNGVPYVLNKSYPTKFIEYFLNDSNCKLIINGLDRNFLNLKTDFDLMLEQKLIHNLKINETEFYKNCQDSKFRFDFDEFLEKISLDENKEAFLLYTSGTSGSPKGVVISFKNLLSSIETMIETYNWSPENYILNPLPLNHYSGLVYCLLTPFLIGAPIYLLPKFNPYIVWSKLLDLNSDINTFIAVPTIYTQLVQEYKNNYNLNKTFNKEKICEILRKKMKLIGSGSAPLNIKTFNDWSELTQFEMVERYGMTEIGMALSTPLIESQQFKRIGGTVGRPCGKVEVRLYDTVNDKVLIESSSDKDKIFSEQIELFGELQINGPTVFKEYLNKPEQTKESFTQDGWFKTGDTAKFLKNSNVYKIIGRTSVDVIKSGGHKLSALDVEKELLAYDLIEDVSVMGLNDLVWGQRVFALIVLKKNEQHKFNKDEFFTWCKSRLPKYSVPTVLKIIENIPKNQLGKVNKKELIEYYEKHKTFD